MSYFAFANLDEQALKQVKSLETKLGHPLVAMKPVDMEPAKIAEDELQALKDLEQRLGVALVAVRH